MIGVTVLGSTGTIGVNTLDVIRRNRDRFRVVALSAHRNVDRLIEQCLEWRPDIAVLADENAAERMRVEVRRVGLETEIEGGPVALETIAARPDVRYVMAGIVGAAGLLPSLAAARAGKRVLLANKEALVMSGRLFMEAVREHGAELVPIDSEHNAIFQCLRTSGDGNRLVGVRRILLTGSGGPFRTLALDKMAAVTPEQACAHPNWVMGQKISVDSATMMNKGLEVIEACWLFDTRTENVHVVIHPQSIVHSMVEYVDGSVLAQLGHPDMRTPIAHGLGWPERVESGVGGLDFATLCRLEFEEPDYERVPCLRFGFEAARDGGTTPTALNAANEIAVAAFLDRKVRFTDIPRIIFATLSDVARREASSLATVLEVDAEARSVAAMCIGSITRCV